MITIINYGLGNLGSIKNMFKHIGYDVNITNEISEIERATKIILPGVGKFDAGMQGILEHGLMEVLNYKAKIEQIPILGICLGMQLMTNGSEEGEMQGLGWVDAFTYRFVASDPKDKIPHMGWNEVCVKKENPLICSQELESKFYFVHSYYVKTKYKENSILETKHINEFSSGIQNKNIMGVQFHPEKSHKYGMSLLRNFAEL